MLPLFGTQAWDLHDFHGGHLIFPMNLKSQDEGDRLDLGSKHTSILYFVKILGGKKFHGHFLQSLPEVTKIGQELVTFQFQGYSIQEKVKTEIAGVIFGG